MRATGRCLALLVLLSASGCPSEPTTTEPVVDPPLALDPFDSVDPFTGSGGQGGRTGSGLPGASLPQGMAQISPDTSASWGAAGFSHCSGYAWDDQYIDGFSVIHTHGMGVPDYGHFLWTVADGVTPTDDGGLTEFAYRQPFSHDEESASPGRYQVRLQEIDVHVDIGVTLRGGLIRFTIPAGMEDPVVVFDTGHSVPDTEVAPASASYVERDGVGVIDAQATVLGGYSRRVGGAYFALHAEVSPAPSEVGVFDHSSIAWGETSHERDDGGLLLRFPASDQEQVIEVRLAVSPVDPAGAQSNFEAEMEGAELATLWTEAESIWRERLDRIRVEGGTEDEQRRFYTAVYQAHLEPQTYSDADGRYPGFDGEVHIAEDFVWYSDLSIWDTFRTWHPLMNLVWPELSEDINRSLMGMAEQGGILPRWPISDGYTGGMTGSHADLVLVDAALRGVGGFDPDEALSLMVDTARGTLRGTGSYTGRWNPERYRELGYQPHEGGGRSTSNTLEWSWDDAGIAALAEHLGEDEIAAEFRDSASFWRNTWNPETGFFHARSEDGSFAELTEPPTRWSGEFVEANAWQFLFHVPQDPAGLAEVLGGEQAAIERLTEFFTLTADEDSMAQEDQFGINPYYWHGNEPSIHASLLFTDWGRQDLATRWSHWVFDTRYWLGASGMPGNDDFGTMSAWYILVGLGLYPVPSRSEWLLAGPVFERAELDLPGGTLVIEQGTGSLLDRDRIPVSPDENRSLVNHWQAPGSETPIPLMGPYVEHADLVGGGTLRIADLDETP